MVTPQELTILVDAVGAVLLEVEPVRMGAVELVSDDVIGTELLEVELVRVDDDP